MPHSPMHRNRFTRALAATTLGLGLTVTAAACSSEDGGGESTAQVSSTQHNDADVAFASTMLQHHAQALSMVDLTRGRPLDREVQQLAEEIRQAQAPEIETFSDWLTDWDEEVPETMRDHANAGHGGDDGQAMEGMEGMEGMAGMMSAADMEALRDAPDRAFQTMWLEMMVEHHEGAVEMAEVETQEGRYAPAVDLAGDIAASQTEEIETMRSLLG